MKKLFSKTIAVVLSAACVGSLMTASFDGKPLFIQERIVHAEEITSVDNAGLSFDESTGKLTLSGEIYTSRIVDYSNKDMVKSIEAEKGTVFKPNSNAVFYGYSNVETIDLSNVNTSQFGDMSLMFSGCKNLKSINLSGLETKNVGSMSSMFRGCSSLKSLDLSGFNTKKVISTWAMFEGCSSLESLDLSDFNTKNVETMSYMFKDCHKLGRLNIGSFDTSKVTDMLGMFVNCSSLEQIELNNFNTQNVKSMGHMFYGCSGINALDISSFDTRNVTQMNYMFGNCSNLKTIKVSEKWSTDSVLYEISDLFVDCNKLVGGNGTKYNRLESFNLKSHGACIDTLETPGYLTLEKGESYLYEAVITSGWYPRTSPSENSPAAQFEVLLGEIVKVIDKENDWVEISTQNGKQGWIPSGKINQIKKPYERAKVTARNGAAILSIKKIGKSNVISQIGQQKESYNATVTIYAEIPGKWVKIDPKENKWLYVGNIEKINVTNSSVCSESGHDYGEWKITNKPSCTEKGKKVRICTRVGCNHEDTEILEPVAHNKVWEISKDPTCEHEGERIEKCSGCGTVFNKESLPAIGHDYKENICTRCGKTVSFNVKNVAELMPLCFGYNGEAFDMDRYPIQNYNGKNVICFEFTTNYPWSVSAPHYINIHNKETCEPITNGGAGTYSLYIWMDSDLYWGKIIGSIKDHHYSEISKPQEITFNVQGAVFSYGIDPFHINEIPAHDYFGNIVSEISDFATDGKYDIIDYICGRVITGDSSKTLYYKDNKFYCFKSELIDEFSLSIDYSVKEPANTSIDSHSYIVNDDIFYTVPFDLYSIAVASVQYKTAYKGVLDFSGGSAGISVHIYPGTILELDQNGFCTWCYNPTNDNDYTYWYFYDSLDHMVKMN